MILVDAGSELAVCLFGVVGLHQLVRTALHRYTRKQHYAHLELERKCQLVVKRILSACCVLLFLLKARNSLANALKRVQTVHVALHIVTAIHDEWIQGHASVNFYHKLGTVVFIWVHLLSAYEALDMMFFVALQAVFMSVECVCENSRWKLPRWCVLAAEIGTFMALFTIHLWKRSLSPSTYLYALWVPYDWCKRFHKEQRVYKEN